MRCECYGRSASAQGAARVLKVQRECSRCSASALGAVRVPTLAACVSGVRTFERLYPTKICNHGTTAQAIHLAGEFCREVSSLSAFVDAVLCFSQRPSRRVEVRALLTMPVLVEPLGLVSTCGRNRVAQVRSEPLILRRRRAVVRVGDDQLSKLIRKLPTNELRMRLRHAGRLSRPMPAEFARVSLVRHMRRVERIAQVAQMTPRTHSTFSTLSNPQHP